MLGHGVGSVVEVADLEASPRNSVAYGKGVRRHSENCRPREESMTMFQRLIQATKDLREPDLEGGSATAANA